MTDTAPEMEEGSNARAHLDRLMGLYQQGDEKATIALIEFVSPMLLRFFLRYPGNQDHAPDLLQETWLRVHRVRHTYRPGAPVLPWLYAIARHVRADGYRKRQRIVITEQAMEGIPEARVNGGASPHHLPSFDFLMGTLPTAQREVITMLKVTGMSLEDVARVTATSVGAVKQKAHRAYRKLREVLERSGAGKGSWNQ